MPLRRHPAFAALLGLSAVVLAGCATPPPAPASGASKSSALPCIVSDQGGFDDNSFNELGLDGVKAAARELGTTYKAVQSTSANDYASNLQNLVTQGCTIIVASGFNLVTAVKAAAADDPKTDFAMIDDASIHAPNVKPVVFATDQAAFLGGYVAAAYSKSGVVGTWGGAPYPSVTLYMDGVADGVAYFNRSKHRDVKLLGWNEASQRGTFVGNFADQNRARAISANMLDQGADVLIPVAGTLYQGAAAAITASKREAVLEGVDADLYATDTSGSKDLFLVSILKNIEPAVRTVVTAAGRDTTFDDSTYVGTLKNGGVGLSSFHGFASRLPAGLTADLAKVRAGIIDGSIEVASPSSVQR